MSLPQPRNVLPLEGQVDLNVSAKVTGTINELIKDKPARLVVDLSGVTYIDSSGLAVLIEAMQSVEEYGGIFAIAGLQETVRSIFEIARLDQVFRIFPDVNSALTAT